MANVDSLNTFPKTMLTHVDVGSCFPVRARLGLMHLSCVRWPPELLPRCALLLLLSCDDAPRSAALEHPSLHIFVELSSAVAGSTSSRAGLRLPDVGAAKHGVVSLGHEAPATLLGRLLHVGVGVVLRHALQHLQRRHICAFRDGVLIALPPAGAPVVAPSRLLLRALGVCLPLDHALPVAPC